MTGPQPGPRGYLVTFKPCGDVQHMTSAPKAGAWMTHWHPRKACQTSGQVVSVEPCPGCPDCPGICPHGRDVFAWLGHGPAADGTYPWAHAAPARPGQIEVCALKPFAAASETGRPCACEHQGGRHSLAVRDSMTRTMPCQDCDCADLRHRREDLEAWRAAEAARRESTPPAPVR
jgi:hypothetical protein